MANTMPTFNTEFVARRASPTELVALRSRMTQLMRPGALAQELAQAALEYYYYVHLNAVHAPPMEPHHKNGAPTLHSLSNIEMQRALHSYASQQRVPFSTSPVHNAHVRDSLSMLHHMRQ